MASNGIIVLAYYPRVAQPPPPPTHTPVLYAHVATPYLSQSRQANLVVNLFRLGPSHQSNRLPGIQFLRVPCARSPRLHHLGSTSPIYSSQLSHCRNSSTYPCARATDPLPVGIPTPITPMHHAPESGPRGQGSLVSTGVRFNDENPICPSSIPMHERRKGWYNRRRCVLSRHFPWGKDF